MAGLTKLDIALQLAKKYEGKVSQTMVKKIVQGTFDAIEEALVKNGRMELRNFGVFTVKTRQPRKARNPKTGEEVMLPERKVVTFKAGQYLLNMLKK